MITTYDSIGRVSQNTYHDSVHNVDGTYTRYVYPTSQNIVQSYSLLNSGGSETYSATLTDGFGRAYATASDHLDSTGGYRGQYTEYNAMGRASQVSRPTEMNSSWHNAGDDYNSTNTWTYTAQTYDWKGRPLVTTNPDSTTKSVSYGGCGCAGGEVATFTDESGVSKRITSDVLGRQFKTEVLDHTASVYSTSTTTFNVRDQATQIDGTVGTSGTTWSTVMGYDNYGRLSSKHVPFNVTGTATSTTYNADDTVATVTDPRGVVATFTYNKRHQVTGVSYDKSAAPSYVVATTSLAFAYDDAGNRTSMTDGSGSTTYQYDVWSHMTSETKEFSNLSGDWTLAYTYNLAGQLASVTDPWGGEVTYTHDDSGQLTTVGGVNYTDTQYIPNTYWDYDFPTVSTFATNLRYRAWGGLKSMSYSDGNTLAISYNDRMQMTEFNASNLIHATYTYRDNGQVSYMHDTIDNRYDRSYGYDDYARLTLAKTGSEANGGSSSTWTGPYLNAMSYDVWGQMTGRSVRLWQYTMNSGQSSYSGSRSHTSDQDDAGHKFDRGQIYDAAANQTGVNFGDLSGSYTLTENYDGDGNVTYRNMQITEPEGDPDITWYVRSSVLGGNVIAELVSYGTTVAFHATHIYVNGQPLAKVGSSGYHQYVSWKYQNPVTGSHQETAIGTVGATGIAFDNSEVDSFGQVSGIYDPYAGYEIPSSIDLIDPHSLFVEDGNPFDPFGGCSAYGMQMSCGEAAREQELDDAAFGATNYVTIDGQRTYSGKGSKRGVFHLAGTTNAISVLEGRTTFGGSWISTPFTVINYGLNGKEAGRIVVEDLIWVPNTDIGSLAVQQTGQQKLITPGTFGKQMPNSIDDKLQIGFKNIQTKAGCMAWIQKKLDEWNQAGIIDYKKAETLLEQTLWGYYDPNDPGWTKRDSWQVAAMGEWANYQAVKGTLEYSFTSGQATAYTPPGNNSFVFLTSGYRDKRIDPSRVLVHEMFHVAGIHTPKGGNDPLVALDAEILKNCGNGDPNQH